MTDEATEILRRVEFHLAILTSAARRSAKAAFDQDILKTEARIRMYALMDGTRSIPEIARAAQVTPPAVRDLLKLLEPKGFVTMEAAGAAQAPRANESAVVDWALAADG